MNHLIWASVAVFAFNIPFGYWRSNVPRYSLSWIGAIHIPVPFIVGLRILSGIGFAWYSYLFLVAAFSMGQMSGSFVHGKLKKICNIVSSCLFMDIGRCFLQRTGMKN